MSAENPADVIEQGDARRKRIEVARNFIAEEVSEQPGWTPTSIAFVLDDAGLLADPAALEKAHRRGFYEGADSVIREELADPADRVGSYGQPTYEDLRTACHLLGERLKRAEAEVARLQQWKDEASPVMIGLQDLGKALGIPLGTRITGEVAAEKAAELRATVDRVRALADGWAGESYDPRSVTDRYIRGRDDQLTDCTLKLGAALDGGGQQ